MHFRNIPRQDAVHMADVRTRLPVLRRWEKLRSREAHWFAECAAECLATFFYVFAGVGAGAGYVLGGLIEQNVTSLTTIGLAYALGIVFALTTCAATSGGHFSPSITIAHVLLGGFPKLKAVRYIVAQILGGYLACLLVYVQWRPLIEEVILGMKAKGVYEAIMFTPQGPAGIFALYKPAGAPIGNVFLNEFVCDFLIGIIIWGANDATNFLVPPAVSPWIIAFGYTMICWGFAPAGLAANSARDIGPRFAAMTIWGREAAGDSSYAALAALTNIPANLLGAMFYEFVLTDSSRVITPAHLAYINGTIACHEHQQHDDGAALTPMSSNSDRDAKV